MWADLKVDAVLEQVAGRQLQFVVRLRDGDGSVASGHIILRVVADTAAAFLRDAGAGQRRHCPVSLKLAHVSLELAPSASGGPDWVRQATSAALQRRRLRRSERPWRPVASWVGGWAS